MKVPVEVARELQNLVWALWTNHRDRRLDAAMEAASNALLEGRRDDARTMLDQLVADAPDWAEAWNKRAILAFSEDRDEDAVADILRVVELEPRHFGALAGLGQILARHGRAREAIAGCQSPSKVAGFVTRIGGDSTSQVRVWRVDGGPADNPVQRPARAAVFWA